MKGGKTHVVPLAPDIERVLEKICPAAAQGDFVLSITEGRKPISSFSKLKEDIDALIKADLEAQGLPFEPWHLHDIRRTVRTRLSGLGIPREIREMIIAHAQPELDQIYDQHDYEREKLAGLKKWHAKLRSIVADNVVELPRKRA